MLEYFLFVIILLLSFSLTYLLIVFKDKINLYAYPNHRTMHDVITPNSGGIAIFISFIAGLLILQIDISLPIILSMFLIFLVGLYDDYFGATLKQKILLLFIIANILFFNDIYIYNLGTFMGNEITMNSFFAYIFLIFAIIGFVNSFNLIDGIDGLASVVGIIILASFLYIGIKFSDQFLIYLSAIYIVSILGFLYFNWFPANIFMGDNGSLSLGLIISIVAIHSINMGYITTVTVMMLAALPVMDTFIVMTRRILSGKSPFSADKQHIHHILLKNQNNNTKRTVLILGLLQFIFSYIGLGFKIRDDMLIIILFIIFSILLYLILIPKK